MYVREIVLKDGRKYKNVDIASSFINGFVRMEFLSRKITDDSSGDFCHFDIVHFNTNLIEHFTYEQEHEGHSPQPMNESVEK